MKEHYYIYVKHGIYVIYAIEGFKPMGITHTCLYPSKTHTHSAGMGFWWVRVWVEA